MSNEHETPRNDDPPRIDDGTRDTHGEPRFDDGTQHDAPRFDDGTQHEAPRFDDGTQHEAPRFDDGTADGESRQAPPLVEPAQGSSAPGSAEPPRYGERITPGSAPSSESAGTDAPTQAYGRPESDRQADATPTQAYAPQHDGGQQYGRQDQYGRDGQQAPASQWGDQQHTQQDQQHTQQYGQQWNTANDHRGSDSHDQHHGAAPVYGQPNGDAWQSYDEPKPVKKKKTVGVVAFIVAILALVVGVIAGYLFGHAFSGDSAIRDAIQNNPSGSLSPSEQEQLQRDAMSDPALAAQIGGAGTLFVIGTVLGLWAIVQGIIAAVAKRGRAFGVLAIILAVVALIAFAVTTAGFASGS